MFSSLVLVFYAAKPLGDVFPLAPSVIDTWLEHD
jgi:hypothetical protein